MGLISSSGSVHPYDIIEALLLEDGEIKIDHGKGLPIAEWGEVRKRLYESILNNAYEFRAQTAMKWAIEECADHDPALRSKAAWRLTDPELTFEHLRRRPFSRMLVDRLRVGSPPDLLFSAWLEDLSPLMGTSSGNVITQLSRCLSELTNTEVYVNYYADKRIRLLGSRIAMRPTLFDGVPSESVGSDPVSRKDSHSRAGVLGALFVSRSEKVAAISAPSSEREGLAKRMVRRDQIERILEECVGCKPSAFSNSWISAPQRPTKPSLLLTTEDERRNPRTNSSL